MPHETSRGGSRGKDFPEAARRGKKCRRALGGLGGCVVVWALAGGLGIVEAQDPSTAGSHGALDVRATVTFTDEAVVAGTDIRLGDVAAISTDDANLAERLAELVVGRAPRVGHPSAFRAQGVRILLRRVRDALGVDHSAVRLEGATLTRVRAEGQTIEPATLLDHVRPWVVEQAALAYGADRVEVDYSTTGRRITVARGDWELVPQLDHLPTRALSSLSLPVTFVLEGRPTMRLNLALKLRLFSTLAVSKRAVQRHEAIGDADVEYIEVDLTKLNGTAVVRDDEALGDLRATRDILAGEPLSDANCELIPTVLKGDQVTVYLEAPHIRLRTIGEAQQNGRTGDVIWVKNLRSDKLICGTIIRERLIHVELPEFQVGAALATASTP